MKNIKFVLSLIFVSLYLVNGFGQYRGANIQNKDFSKKTFKNGDFYGARANGANFFGAGLKDASFYGAHLTNTQFKGANVSKSTFYGADLKLAKMERANADEANFEGADLHRGTFNGTSFRCARFYGTSLNTASCKKCDFSGANLDRADLRAADLSGSKFTNANITANTLIDSNTKGLPAKHLWGKGYRAGAACMKQFSKPSKVTPASAGNQNSKHHFDGLCTAFGEQTTDQVKTKQYRKSDYATIERALTASTNNLWSNGKVISVSMDNTVSEDLRMKIFNIAQEWSKYANVLFKLVPSNGDIRIKFNPNDGHYSLIGKLSADWAIRAGLDVIGRGTMNLQVNESTPESSLRRVVLHEFGHALGFRHEHQNPSVSIPWDKDKVYEFYQNNLGWDRGKVNHNLFTVLDKGQSQYSSFDPSSIMVYPVPNSLTIGNYSIPYNSRLSDIDKSFAQILYPFPNFSGNKIRINLTTGSYDLREKCNANLIIKYRQGSSLKELQISLNRGEKWYHNKNYSKDISLPSGVGINDIQSATIFWQSVDRVWTDDDADWRINMIRLSYIDSNGNIFPIMDEQRGNPYVDFKGNTNQYFEMTF